MQTRAKHYITPFMVGVAVLVLVASALLWLRAPGWALLASPFVLLPYAVVVELFHRYKHRKIMEDVALLLDPCKGWYSTCEWREVKNLQDFIRDEIPSRIAFFDPLPAGTRAKLDRIHALAEKARKGDPSPHKIHECEKALRNLQQAKA